MSLAMAIQDGQKTYLVTDRRISGGAVLYQETCKIAVVGRCALAVLGPVRNMVEVRKHAADIGVAYEKDGAQGLADAVRDVFRDAGFQFKTENGCAPRMPTQTLLLAAPDGVYAIETCFTVERQNPGVIYATGAGDDLAVGYYTAIQERERAAELIHEALAAFMAFPRLHSRAVRH
jgi:hypothetical protein